MKTKTETHIYEEVDPQFLVSLLAREVEESDFAIFKAAFAAGGYLIPEEQIDAHFGRYLRAQHVPEVVARYCRNVLLGKAPHIGSTGCYLLA